MIGEFISEQRSDMRKLNSLIKIAEKGEGQRFEQFLDRYLGDDALKEKVHFLKDRATELYQKEIEVRAFNEEFQERPHAGAETRWNVTDAGKVPDYIVRSGWNEKEFYQKYMARVLTLEVEQKEKSILSLERQNLGLAR